MESVMTVLVVAMATFTSGQVLPSVSLNIFDNFQCNSLGSGTCKTACDPGELSVYPYTCSLYSYFGGVSYQRCVTSMPCCALPGATCQSSCGSGQAQLSNQWTCSTTGQVCCAGSSQVITSSTSKRTLTSTAVVTRTVAARQGVCGTLTKRRSLSDRDVRLSARLLGGTVAWATDWPWMVRLTYTTSSGFCAGVLVDADTVVTAAHCVAGVSTSAMRVILADYDTSRIDTGEESVGVASSSLIAGFIRGTRGRDFAVVKLARSVGFTDRKLPACLADPTIPLCSPMSCYVAGWGVSEKGVGGPIRAASVQILDKGTCQSRIGSTLPSDIICINNPVSAPVDGCNFDDGDMLVCRDTRDRWSLIGVMSEYSCGKALPILFTDVRPYVEVTLGLL